MDNSANEKYHRGVGLVITNPSKDKFFFQIKDKTYSPEKWIGSLSFWGGQIEDDDKDKIEALNREIIEELPEAAEFLISVNKTKVNEYIVFPESEFAYTLFEAVISDTDLENLENIKIEEGFGKLISKANLNNYTWIWGLEKVLESYLNIAQ